MTFLSNFERILGDVSLLQLQLDPTISWDMASKSHSATSNRNI